MDKGQTVLILEYDRKLLQKLETEIAAIGYTPVRSAFPDIKMADIFHRMPAAVIIGLNRWDSDIKNACEAFMKKTSISDCFPVIALLGKDTINEVPPEMGFSGIAVMPYTLQELDLRLDKAISQYKLKENRGVIVIGEISIDTSSCEVWVRQKPLSLTFKEYELLKYLAINRGHVYTRTYLLNAIWGRSYYGGTRTVDVHIRRLRNKIGDSNQRYIKTIRGLGYSFHANPAEYNKLLRPKNHRGYNQNAPTISILQ
jgi:DNA-binding response OmpR family regulator